MNIFKAELRKLKGSRIILAMIILPLLSVIYGSINYYMNTGILKKEWISLWTQVYLFYGMLFLPALIGVICSYTWAGEHKNNNMNLILTSTQKFKSIILAKMMVAFFMVIMIQSYMWILFTIVGLILKFQMKYPVELFKYLVLSTVFCFSIISIQSFASLKIKSFSAPVVIALVYNFFGLLANAKMRFCNYIFTSQSLAREMNMYPEISFNNIDFLIMTVIMVVILTVFINLQILDLKSKLN